MNIDVSCLFLLTTKLTHHQVHFLVFSVTPQSVKDEGAVFMQSGPNVLAAEQMEKLSKTHHEIGK